MELQPVVRPNAPTEDITRTARGRTPRGTGGTVERRDPADLAEVARAVKIINNAMKAMSRDIEFSLDNDTRQTVVRIRDRETGQVIRQFPSEEALAIAQDVDRLRERLGDSMRGIMLRQKA